MVKIVKVLFEPPSKGSPYDTYKCEVFSLTSPCKTPFVAHFNRAHYMMPLLREKLVDVLPKELWHDLEELESLNWQDGSENGYEIGCDMGDGE